MFLILSLPNSIYKVLHLIVFVSFFRKYAWIESILLLKDGFFGFSFTQIIFLNVTLFARNGEDGVVVVEVKAADVSWVGVLLGLLQGVREVDWYVLLVNAGEVLATFAKFD